MKIVITGSEGLIGSHIRDRLEDDHEVVCYDKKLSKNVLDANKDDLEGTDLIIHCAANTFIRNTIDNPDLGKENIDTTYKVYELARQVKANVVFFSSSRAQRVHVRNGKINPYVASKRLGEDLAKAYRHCYGVNSVIIRPETVWGYTEDERVMVKWIRNALNDEPIEIYGNESKQLSPLYVENFVDYLMDILDNIHINFGRIVFVSGKVRTAMNIAEDIIDVANSDSSIILKEEELTQPQKCVRSSTNKRIDGDLKSEVSKVIKQINNEK